jgi:hypothetical protein
MFDSTDPLYLYHEAHGIWVIKTPQHQARANGGIRMRSFTPT